MFGYLSEFVFGLELESELGLNKLKFAKFDLPQF